MRSRLKGTARRLLVLAAIATLAGLGGWVAWQTHMPRPTVTLSLTGAFTFAGFSDDGRTFVAIQSRTTDGTEAHRIVCWDATTCGIVRDEPWPENLKPAGLLPSPYHRNWLLVTDTTHQAVATEVYQLHPWKRLGSVSFVSGMVGTQVLSPCRGWLLQKVEKSDQPQVELWNLATAQRAVTLPGEFIRFSPSGKLLATMDKDDLCLWQFPGGQLVRRFPPHPSGKFDWVAGMAGMWPDLLWIDETDQFMLNTLSNMKGKEALARLEPIQSGAGPSVEWPGCGLLAGGRQGRYFLGIDLSILFQNGPIRVCLFGRLGSKLTLESTLFTAGEMFQLCLIEDRLHLVTAMEAPTLPTWIESALEWLNLRDAWLEQGHQTALVLDLASGAVLFRHRVPAKWVNQWKCIPASSGRSFALLQSDEQKHELQLWHLPLPTPWLRLVVGASVPVAFIAVIALLVAWLKRPRGVAPMVQR